MSPITIYYHFFKYRVGSKTAEFGEMLDMAATDLEDQLRHLPAGKTAQGLLVLGGESLPTDRALHFLGARVERLQILMSEHAVPLMDVDYLCSKDYAGFAFSAKRKLLLFQISKIASASR